MADPVDDLLPLIGVNHNLNDDSDSSNSTHSSDSDEEFDGDEEDTNGEDAVGRNKRQRDKEKKRAEGDRSVDGENSQVIVNFDKSLPATHSYLGNDMDELRGRTILEENSVVTMPILLLPNVVLVPGQIIPLYLNTFSYVSMVRRASETDKTFGVLNVSHTETGGNVSDIGCTAEIFCIKDESDSSLSILRAKAMGRQRFRVMDDLIRDIAGGLKAPVKILPEMVVSDALDGARIGSLSRLMVTPSSEDPEDTVKTAVGKQGQVLTSVDFRQHRNPLKNFLSYSTPWPSWVYRLYDVEWLCEQIKLELESWNWKSVSLPKDPVGLSYWVAHNLPVDDSIRLFILSLNSVVQRLRFGLSVIQKSGVSLRCIMCDHEISNKKEVFSMTEEGPVGAYVNPGGYVHEMFTVLAIDNLSHIGRPSTEHSWFPGYAWTIVQCNHCHSHMGWKFTAVKSHLAPKKFWGLCRSSVETKFSTSTEGEEGDHARPIHIM